MRLTCDLDITYSLSSENLDRLGDVLVGLNAYLRGVKDGIPFVPDGRTLRRTRILTLDTELGWFDLIGRARRAPPLPRARGRGSNDRGRRRSKRPIASVAHLLAMKRAANRGQDGVDVAASGPSPA